MAKSQRFDFVPTALSGLTVIQRKPSEDTRGTFARMYCAAEFRVIGVVTPISQINQSITRRKGAVRGLHFQYPPYAETKIVSCMQGVVFDVAVDVRSDSPTFLQWHGEILSAQNHRSLLIPEGYAHGFQTLAENCEIMYLHTAEYAPGSEGALNVRDPALGIDWPLPISELSARDAEHPFVSSGFRGIRL